MQHWPESARERIQHLLRELEPNEDYFAVFDADNTLWEHDLEEALMPWLENQGILSLANLDPAIKPIPPLPEESLWNYYHRLCEIDDSVGYLWVCQVFEGLSLDVIRENIHALLQHAQPIPTNELVDGVKTETFVQPPRVFQAQIELIDALKQAGVEVWVVSAALEELVRMVAADPLFGLNIPAERVIGVNLLLRDQDGSLRISAHDRARLVGHEAYFAPSRLQATLTHHLFAPATWYQGKVSAIRKWIHPVKAPILVAGDSQNDLPMLFEVDGAKRGVRLWVDRKETYRQAAYTEANRRGEQFNEAFGWLLMSPTQLHG